VVSRPVADGIPDRRLELLTVCAHPAIDAGIRTPLMLQAAFGFDATRIGRAFDVGADAMAQRLVRAKRRGRDRRGSRGGAWVRTRPGNPSWCATSGWRVRPGRRAAQRPRMTAVVMWLFDELEQR